MNSHLKLDEVFFSGKASQKRGDFPSGANIRTAEVTVQGGIGPCTAYVFRLEFSRFFFNRNIHFDDAYLKYTGFQESTVLIGQIPIPFSLENTCSSKWMSFLERPLPMVAFSPPYGLGISLTKSWNVISITSALAHPRHSVAIFNNDNLGLSTRLIFSPVHIPREVYHLGLSARYQNVHPRHLVMLGVKPEIQARNTPFLIRTGPLRGIHHYVVTGIDAAILQGPLTVQGEYAEASLQKPQGFSHHLHFKGAYVQASYLLTGESRIYHFETGTFGRVYPEGPYGAFEIAIRDSYLSLNDKTLRGGCEHNLAFSFGWYANDNVRIFGNYIRANLQPHDSPKRKLDIVGIRFQYVY